MAVEIRVIFNAIDRKTARLFFSGGDLKLRLSLLRTSA